MADYDALTYHRLIGRYNGIIADTTGPSGDPGTTPDLYAVNMSAMIRLAIARDGKLVDGPPELRLTGATPPRTLLLIPIRANVESGVLRLPGADTGTDGVDIVADSAILGLADNEQLVATVTFGDTTIGGNTYRFDPVSYVVPTVEPEDYDAYRVQTVRILNASGGTWALVYGKNPTVTLPPAPEASVVQTALRGLFGGNEVLTVTGTPGEYVVSFDPVAVPRPLPLGVIDNLTPQAATVQISDAYTPVTVDLTTVPRWTRSA
ncbi:hypothetical protein SEA_AMOCHICK_37 [Mycobacterium phage Amochick]|uniref:Uncharacterized protein n=2 Tax=Gilesvirus giles TaxID=1982151 RepID=A0A385D045_9CAUD|nr:hypothetical protein SEA_AMOCHICK_37 [Mycobacterium phage Amochick]QBQ71239.1 hypothetical protein SEA_DAEGAL_38 [Mycobacterium phage Daegal]